MPVEVRHSRYWRRYFLEMLASLPEPVNNPSLGLTISWAGKRNGTVLRCHEWRQRGGRHGSDYGSALQWRNGRTANEAVHVMEGMASMQIMENI